jgi:hypothetical protein
MNLYKIFLYFTNFFIIDFNNYIINFNKSKFNLFLNKLFVEYYCPVLTYYWCFEWGHVGLLYCGKPQFEHRRKMERFD